LKTVQVLVEERRLVLSEERHSDAHCSLERHGHVVVELAPCGRERARWDYDYEDDARRAIRRLIREAAA
jgi:hypothetical protein